MKVTKYDIEYEIDRVYPLTRSSDYDSSWEQHRATVFYHYSKQLELFKKGTISLKLLEDYVNLPDEETNKCEKEAALKTIHFLKSESFIKNIFKGEIASKNKEIGRLLKEIKELEAKIEEIENEIKKS